MLERKEHKSNKPCAHEGSLSQWSDLQLLDTHSLPNHTHMTVDDSIHHSTETNTTSPKTSEEFVSDWHNAAHVVDNSSDSQGLTLTPDLPHSPQYLHSHANHTTPYSTLPYFSDTDSHTDINYCIVHHNLDANNTNYGRNNTGTTMSDSNATKQEHCGLLATQRNGLAHSSNNHDTPSECAAHEDDPQDPRTTLPQGNVNNYDSTTNYQLHKENDDTTNNEDKSEVDKGYGYGGSPLEYIQMVMGHHEPAGQQVARTTRNAKKKRKADTVECEREADELTRVVSEPLYNTQPPSRRFTLNFQFVTQLFSSLLFHFPTEKFACGFFGVKLYFSRKMPGKKLFSGKSQRNGRLNAAFSLIPGKFKKG